MPITQYFRQLVELTESSGGDGVSQVHAFHIHSCDGHHNQDESYNADIRVQQQTCTSWQLWVGVATRMGCQGCLGLLTAEVSLAWRFGSSSHKGCIFVVALWTQDSLLQAKRQPSAVTIGPLFFCFLMTDLSKKPKVKK